MSTDRKIALLEGTIKEILRIFDDPHPDLRDVRIDDMFDTKKAEQLKDILNKARRLVSP